MTWMTAVIAGVAVLGLAGCAAASPTLTLAGAAGTVCGQTRTAAGLVVAVDVAQGPVNCAVALRVEAGYAAAIRDGDLRGNGGGAPVNVDGWTCQSYPTTQALRTGKASECHTAKAEVVAVLSPSSTSSALAVSAGSTVSAESPGSTGS